MSGLALNPGDASGQLDVLAQSPALPARDAARCAQLANTLRRPARVCILGAEKASVDAVVTALFAEAPEVALTAWPNALELRHGAVPRAHLTFADGTTLTHEGWPNADLLRSAPIFLQLELPLQIFDGRTFVGLSLCGDPDSCRQALYWAARRAEIAVWCTSSFGSADAAIWSDVPERLSHHAYLVELDSAGKGALRETGFTGTIRLPRKSEASALDVGPLLSRLSADIEEARVADMDAAQMMLYRLRRYHAAATECAEARGPAVTRPAASPEVRRALSEPILFLQRRARALAEDMIWAEAEQDEAWPVALMKGCVEVAEALRDRSAAWPDDLPDLAHVSAAIDEACDTLLLLQMEGGAARAGDAAALVWQLRLELEQAAFPDGEAP